MLVVKIVPRSRLRIHCDLQRPRRPADGPVGALVGCSWPAPILRIVHGVALVSEDKRCQQIAMKTPRPEGSAVPCAEPHAVQTCRPWRRKALGKARRLPCLLHRAIRWNRPADPEPQFLFAVKTLLRLAFHSRKDVMLSTSLKTLLLCSVLATQVLVPASAQSGESPSASTHHRVRGYVTTAAGQVATQAIRISEIDIPTRDSGPLFISKDADQHIWFTQKNANKIGRLSRHGAIREYDVPTAMSQPYAITLGPDNTMWFTELAGARIGHVLNDGSISEFPLMYLNSSPTGITSGPVGSDLLYFTDYGLERLGRINTQGEVAEMQIPMPNSSPQDLVLGPDGHLWFTQFFGNRIGRVSPSFVYGAQEVPTPRSDPDRIATGLHGEIWFTELLGNKIGRIMPNGALIEYQIPTPDSQPQGIALGPDGHIWFTESATNKIGRISADGTITEYLIPTANSGPVGITAGDWDMFFTEFTANKIGRISLRP